MLDPWGNRNTTFRTKGVRKNSVTLLLAARPPASIASQSCTKNEKFVEVKNAHLWGLKKALQPSYHEIQGGHVRGGAAICAP